VGGLWRQGVSDIEKHRLKNRGNKNNISRDGNQGEHGIISELGCEGAELIHVASRTDVLHWKQ